MSLYKKLKDKMTDLRKAGKNELEKTVLSVVIGETDTLSARTNKEVTNDQIEKIIDKIIESNKEIIKLSSNEELKQKHQKEIDFLDTLKDNTRSLTVHEITELCIKILSDIKASRNDGEATGKAIKFLKLHGFKFSSTDVVKAISSLRKE